MKKRSLFSMIFGNKKNNNTVTKTELQLLSGYNAKFTTISSNIYDSKVARQCIDRKQISLHNVLKFQTKYGKI